MHSEKNKVVWQAHESNTSGANIAMLEYIDALHNVFSFFVILPHQGNMQQLLEQRHIPYTVIHQYGWTNLYSWWNMGKWMKVFLRTIMAIWQTTLLFKKEKPSIVCTNTIVPFTASVAAKLKRIPHVWWIHEFGKEDFGFTIGWGYEKISFWWMQKSSKLIIGNSKAISSKFRDMMSKAVIETIYQPVSWKGTTVRASENEAVFLMFGQLVEPKGHKDVLRAMISNIQQEKRMQRLDIIGPSEIEDYLIELQNIVHQNNLEEYVNIKVGFFDKEEIVPNYDVLIVASKAEAFGRVIVEANKAGLRVLVRNCGGSPELVNETNGLLYENQNVLSAILCGEIKFPDKVMSLNYDEDSEIIKLTTLLNRLC